jgi:hypothetical protein
MISDVNLNAGVRVVVVLRLRPRPRLRLSSGYAQTRNNRALADELLSDLSPLAMPATIFTGTRTEDVER